MATIYERFQNRNRNNRWEDWTIFLVSDWFFFSPWILQFGHNLNTAEIGAAGAPIQAVGRAAWNAWVLGAIVFLVSLSAISRMDFWQERANAVLGVWIFIAPWVLNFAGVQMGAAAWDHWVTGAVIVFCAAYNLWDAQRQRHSQVMGPGE